ncbi:MAG: hypothetical protein ABI588_09145, partial [Arenimonas sp.]
ACALAALVLMRNGKLAARGPQVAWLSIAAILGGLYALWTLYGAGPDALVWGLVLLLASIPVFYLVRRIAPAPGATA